MSAAAFVVVLLVVLLAAFVAAGGPFWIGYLLAALIGLWLEAVRIY